MDQIRRAQFPVARSANPAGVCGQVAGEWFERDGKYIREPVRARGSLIRSRRVAEAKRVAFSVWVTCTAASRQANKRDSARCCLLLLTAGYSAFCRGRLHGALGPDRPLLFVIHVARENRRVRPVASVLWTVCTPRVFGVNYRVQLLWIVVLLWAWFLKLEIIKGLWIFCK